MGYATISDISRRWKVDRATARAALQRAGIPPCDLFASPRYSWDEVLRKIEAWPEPTLERIDRDVRLETAEALADRLGVTPQTVRNYGRAGRLHRIELTPRAVRYGAPLLAKNESEGKTDDLHQK
tara:strand:- start:6683 stop:7057 length:375 start_codon:yes stop_codon:yes gene_type:complete